MEGEINNFIMVWVLAVASLCYCHTIGKFIPKGTTRLLAILPVIFLFLILPLNLTSIYLGALGLALVGVELEPQFDEPYLATSLQDFWGRRWNLMDGVKATDFDVCGHHGFVAILAIAHSSV
uniref:Uncharacterized protein n=1 Tax=Fagus sylvatica TaxID=28930 RepID=A0A2N9ISK3_FAGSY